MPGTRFPTARLTLGQMRRSAGRLTAAGVAIAIGTAFVTVTLLAGDLINRTARDMIAAEYATADLVLSVDDPEGLTRYDDAAVTAIADLDGVAAVQPLAAFWGDLRHAGKGSYQVFVPAPSHESLSPLELTEGTWPARSGQIAIPPSVVERLGVGVGDTVTLQRSVYPDEAETAQGGTGEGSVEGEAEMVEPVAQTDELEITGVTSDPYGAFTGTGGAVAATAGDVAAWTAEEGADVSYEEVLVALDEPLTGTEVPADLRDALAGAAAATGMAADHVAVETTEARAAAKTIEQTGGQDLVFMVFVLTFAAVALLVAGLVITNTFQVLVAQRTGTLALLRCIGAGTGQLYRSVLLEAAILGALASLAGVAVGAVLTQVALLVAPSFDLGIPLPSAISLTATAVVLPLLVGIAVTVLAALSPARAATRVAPLAALRPADAPTLRGRAGRLRAVLTTLATVGGFGLLGLGAALGLAERPDVGLLAGVAGGAISFVGVVLGSVLWLPKVTAAMGRLVNRSGPSARLAVANTLRNPRRTAATSTALLIGVTLVTMMSTGAAGARQSADTMIDSEFATDIIVAPGSDETIDEVRSAVADVEGLAASTAIAGSFVTLGDVSDLSVNAVEPDALPGVINTPEEAAKLTTGTILLTEGAATSLRVADGGTITATGPDGTLDLTVAVTTAGPLNRIITTTDLAVLDADAVPHAVWARLATGADATTVLSDVQDATGAVDDGAMVIGPAAQAAQFRQVVDVILGIVVGLLAVAVVIAVIGVTNTLSLSVIERTRESATLRAIGLSKGQLRRMLAVEGTLIAGVGAGVGILLGVLYGWAGSVTALSLMGDVQLVVPWTDLAVVVGISLVAGLVASVLPARAAARTSPVAALAVE
ncbi:ABC transporter permease [Antribacter gilvus]|uniref:ABC transporter permease n=1 Tax=Antribacter gilvus TaxID=2304675 RepID=UPI000F768D10|nr:FtsX-like permease family protein [Antribacter gilvus]